MVIYAEATILGGNTTIREEQYHRRQRLAGAECASFSKIYYSPKEDMKQTVMSEWRAAP
ncbi:MAG: hypothetical protein R2788_20355 [Saprospiraceae bacterium]